MLGNLSIINDPRQQWKVEHKLSVKSNQPSLVAVFDNYFKLEMLQSDGGDT